MHGNVCESVLTKLRWSKTDETARSTTGKCPEGGVSCGLRSIAQVVDVTGQVRERWGGYCAKDGPWEKFKITAPWLDNTGKALISTQACYLDCVREGNEEFCDKFMADVPMPICPSDLPSVKNCQGQKCVVPPPPVESRYKVGWCGIHVTQYQKPDPSKDSYSLEITLYDGQQNNIGASGKVGPKHSLTSLLPYTVEVSTSARGWDTDPVSFAYADQIWTSENEQCTQGGYESGNRDIDCGFNC